MKTAFLFSGQGAQKVGMGQDLYNDYKESKAIFNKANDILGWDVKELCFSDPNNLINETRYTQPALFTVTVAALEVAKSLGLKADIVAGFSLGEYPALYASGALNFETALRLIEKRAIYMDQESKKTKGSMAAILGMDIGQVEALCLQVESGLVEIANDNCPGQVVVSGEEKAVQELCELAKEDGAKRTMTLNVSGAFHSSLLENAAAKMEEEIKYLKIQEPSIPVVGNVNAASMDAETIKINIPKQITSKVRFRETIDYLIDQDVDAFIEIGIGRTLCVFVRKTNRDKKTYNIDSVKSLNKTMQLLEEKL